MTNLFHDILIKAKPVKTCVHKWRHGAKGGNAGAITEQLGKIPHRKLLYFGNLGSGIYEIWFLRFHLPLSLQNAKSKIVERNL